MQNLINIMLWFKMNTQFIVIVTKDILFVINNMLH